MTTQSWVVALLLATSAWGEQGLVATELKNPSERELHKHVGQSVTVAGRFSLRGKMGPFVVVSGRPIYVDSPDNFNWGEPYTSMEGREVRVTGVLRFVRYPPPEPGASRLPVARRPDHFSFEAGTTTVELAPEGR